MITNQEPHPRLNFFFTKCFSGAEHHELYYSFMGSRTMNFDVVSQVFKEVLFKTDYNNFFSSTLPLMQRRINPQSTIYLLPQDIVNVIILKLADFHFNDHWTQMQESSLFKMFISIKSLEKVAIGLNVEEKLSAQKAIDELKSDLTMEIIYRMDVEMPSFNEENEVTPITFDEKDEFSTTPSNDENEDSATSFDNEDFTKLFHNEGEDSTTLFDFEDEVEDISAIVFINSPFFKKSTLR